MREPISGRGTCKKHTGGLSLYADVALRLEPSEEFELADQLGKEQRGRLKDEEITAIIEYMKTLATE